MPAANVQVVSGDLLAQPVDCIVNSWNRNVIPWWLMIPQGVAGAIKRKAGTRPFHELSKHGPIPLGGAVLTGPGNLPFKGIIHVAGINLLWQADERSIRGCVQNALALAKAQGFTSIAFPLIGAGVGGGTPEKVLAMMSDEAKKSDFPGLILIVQFKTPVGAPEPATAWGRLAAGNACVFIALAGALPIFAYCAFR